MSRLDSFIRRITAQRDCLNAAADLIRDVPGPVLEFGLGNGRTYDHLRSLLPGRPIFVFERQVAAHPDCIPPDECLLLGDLYETLDNACEVIRVPAILAHVDIGSGDPAANAKLATFLAPRLHRLMAPGGIVVSDQDLGMPQGEQVALPPGVRQGRYFMWQV